MMVFKAIANVLSARSKQNKGKTSEQKKDGKPPTAKELNMFLGACKFLATCLLIPEYKAPQFPFYRWVFVNDSLSFLDPTISQKSPSSSSPQSFTPYVTEVTRLLQVTVQFVFEIFCSHRSIICSFLWHNSVTLNFQIFSKLD
ncbi:hypothetical protein FBUS_00354 [Fasciolopsis buskii]|uniref:Uncharacterized protein n=1 Tax=Fasciolopsis buskii TaxID=27845 RepID=A0A8E0S1D2_9TREM|nr:hypothetical protein FBUS_00354 [Fasciolopsis buski]